MEWTALYAVAQETMSERRFAHTLGVVELATKLAQNYRLDPEKARLAALLHDWVRGWPGERLLKKAKDFAIVVTEIDKVQPDLLHGPIAAEVVRREYGITDHDLLEAIRWHTTGHVGMGALAKVIYVADSLESGRDYPGVEPMRAMMLNGLDDIYLAVLQHTLFYLLETAQLIHPESILVRNQLLREMRRP